MQITLQSWSHISQQLPPNLDISSSWYCWTRSDAGWVSISQTDRAAVIDSVGLLNPRCWYMQNRSCQKFRFLFVDCETQAGHEPRHRLLTVSIWKRQTGHTNTSRGGGRVFMHPGETRQTHRGRETSSVTLPFSVKEIPRLPSPSSSQHLWH